MNAASPPFVGEGAAGVREDVPEAVMSALNAHAYLPLVARLTSHPVMISSLDGGTVWVNDAFTSLSGWRLHETNGLIPWQFLHGPATSQLTVEWMAQKVAAGESFQCEIENYRRDGTTFWVAIDAQPIIDSAGALCGYMSVQSDVSDRKYAEAALLREHALLKVISESLSTFLNDDDPRKTFGALLRRLLLLTDSEYGFIGEVRRDADHRPWLKTYAISNIAWNAATQQLYDQNEADGLEFRNLNTLFGAAILTRKPVIANSPSTDPRRGGVPDGHPPLKAFLGLPILRGDEIVAMVGIANGSRGYSEADVEFLDPLLTAIGQLAEAIRRDRQRNQTEQSLRETEEWLEETARVAEVGSWQCDVTTMQLRWSAQTRRMHEVPSDYEPDVQSAIDFYAPEARGVIEAAVRLGIEQGKPWDLELPFVTGAGTSRWVRAKGRAEFDGDKVVRIFGTFQDITERYLAQIEREQLHAQILQSQKMESVGRLAGGIAHDFNNMLAVILGHAEMATLDTTLSQQQREHLKAIQSAGQRSADLTRQLLTFARRQNAAPKQIDVNQSVEKMLSLLRRLIGERIPLHWMPTEGLWTISIDPVQFDQILANLCVNAKDAIAATGRILITTRNERLETSRRLRSCEINAGDYVVLSVSDNGSGIQPGVLQHLFEPFFTTKPVGKGTGLGLATVYGIVQQNSGAIDVASAPAIGTTFRIFFPKAQDPGDDIGVTADQSVSGVSVESVLLVEDEPALLEIGRLSLQQLGCVVRSANSALTALQLVREFGSSIGVVISDVVMPDLSGWELAQQIHHLHPEIRFVFMSGYEKDSPSDLWPPGRMSPVLQKPFDLQQLAQAVNSAARLTAFM